MKNTRATNKLFCIRLTGWVKDFDTIKFAVKGKRLGKYYIIKQNKKGERAIFIKEEKYQEPCYSPDSDVELFYRRLLKSMLGRKILTRW